MKTKNCSQTGRRQTRKLQRPTAKQSPRKSDYDDAPNPSPREREYQEDDPLEGINLDVPHPASVTQRVRAERLTNLFRHNTLGADIGFVPSQEMMLARLDFHQAFKAGRFVADDGTPLTLTESLAVLWSAPNDWHEECGGWMLIRGFRQWFSRPPVVDFQRSSAMLVDLAVRALGQILQGDDPKAATARVQASRTVLEMAGVMTKQEQKVQVLDEAVAKLTPSEQRRLILEAARKEELKEAEEKATQDAEEVEQ